MNMRKNSVSSIRWIIKEFELDIQTIRARIVNNLEALMQQAMDHAKASTKEKKRTKHPRELSRLAGIFFCNRACSQVCSIDRLWIISCSGVNMHAKHTLNRR